MEGAAGEDEVRQGLLTLLPKVTQVHVVQVGMGGIRVRRRREERVKRLVSGVQKGGRRAGIRLLRRRGSAREMRAGVGVMGRLRGMGRPRGMEVKRLK